MKIRQELAYDYLKKVLSPALRYELKKIENEDKMNFKYNSEDSSEEYETLYQLIQKNFGLNDNETSFLTYESINKDKEYIPISTFFNSFEDKPRGLMNIYYYLNSMKKIIQKKKHEGKKDKEEHSYLKEIWTCEELNHFLDIIIDSSSRLNMHKKKIKSLIKIQNLESKNEMEVDIRYNAIIKKDTIIEENLKLELVTLGMFFDGIYCSLYKDKIKEYSENFVKTKEYDEIREIKDFLNSKILKKEDFPMEIIHRMKNPFEMLYVFGIAKKYPLNIETEKEQILVLTKILKHLSSEQLEMNSKQLERNEEQIEIQQITNYINKKNIYDTYWLENLKAISKKASKFLTFEINEELQNLMNYYYSLDKSHIEKQNDEFLQLSKDNWNVIKEKIKEIELIEKSQFDKYFEIREVIFIEKGRLKKAQRIKEELEQKINRSKQYLDEIQVLQEEISKSEKSIEINNKKFEETRKKLKIEDEIQEIIKEKNKLEEKIYSNKVKLREEENNIRYMQIELLEEESRIQELKNEISEEIRKCEDDLEKINNISTIQEGKEILKFIEGRNNLIKNNDKEELNKVKEYVEMKEPQKRLIEKKLEELELKLKKLDIELNKNINEKNEKIQITEQTFGVIRKDIQEKEKKYKKLNEEIRQNEELKIELEKIIYIIETDTEENRTKNIIVNQNIEKFSDEFPILKFYRQTIDNHENQQEIRALFDKILNCLKTDEDFENRREHYPEIYQIEMEMQRMLSEYKTVKEYYQIIEKLQELSKIKENFKKEIFEYLGRKVKYEFIEEEEEEEDVIKYNLDEIDNNYLVNLVITLLKNNKLYEKELVEYHINNIEVALKIKGNDLDTRYNYTTIGEELTHDLNYIKRRNKQYRKYSILNGNKMNTREFVELKKQIQYDLNEESDRMLHRDIDRLKNILYDMEYSEIEKPKRNEILQYRAYCLLYAIIKKETRVNNDYEKIEHFYKDLNTILDANDIKLKEDMFKLDI